MKKNKKAYVIGIVFLLSMMICFIIGQNIVLPRAEKKEQLKKQETESDESVISIINQFESFSLIGNQEVKDNPWGMTIGKTEMEEMGTCILMTPDTGMDIPVNATTQSELTFEVRIHPWVSADSDGAGLVVQVNDNEGNTLDENIVEIKNTDEFIPVNINLNAIKETGGVIKILADNGRNDDNICDWIVIKETESIMQDSSILENPSRKKMNSFFISAHYFADEWPLNFWNSEMDHLKNDMMQIKADGFNSIILVVPWREFQPTISPITYNSYAFDQLENIMKEAANADLGVLVRAGYIWDFYEDSDVSSAQRYYDIPGNAQLRTAWNLYLDTLYKSLDKHDNFWGGFITWEDYWNNTYLADSVGGKPESIDLPVCKEFQKYIERMYTLEAFNRKYGTGFSSYSSIYIPTRTEPFMEAYYAFYDEWLNSLLIESQNYFPNLSMEVRNDWDSMHDTKGNQAYYKHDATYACGNAEFSTLMYGIPQGNINNGERLTWEEALEKTKYILDSFNEANPTKEVFVDQFIFADNTPGFEKNAQIKEDQVNTYLEHVSDILSESSCGYGIWTYKDYTNNMFYNSQFALGSSGWDVLNATVEKIDGSNSLILPANEEIKQEIPAIRSQFAGDTFILELDAALMGGENEKAFLEVTVGNIKKTIEVNKNQKRYSLTIEKPNAYNVIIKSSEYVRIDNLDLYNHIQNGFLYDLEGGKMSALDSLRKLNQDLQNR